MTIHEPPELPTNEDRTIFIPRPGGRGKRDGPRMEATPPIPEAAFPEPSYPSQAIRSDINPQTGNPLLIAGSALFDIAAQLRITLSLQDVNRLRSKVLQEFVAFENRCRSGGVETDISHTARFILCAYIDELVLNTVWGSNSAWAEQSLLSTLYSETRGGEVFFVILDRLLKDPRPNTDLLELIYICISLGFLGRYGVLERGAEKLEELRSITFERIRQTRGEISQDLSPHWRGQTSTKKSLRTIVPLWVVAAVAGVLLMAVYFGFSLILNESAQPSLQALEQLAVQPIEKSTVAD
ncbi:MAG: type IVB secretion system protein IcmH/DotU [Thiohalomonadales bacterium]